MTTEPLQTPILDPGTPTTANASVRDAARVILLVGRHLATALSIPAPIAEVILKEQAQRIGHPVPTVTDVLPQGQAFPPNQGALVLTYAVASLVRGGSAKEKAAIGQITTIFGWSTALTELALLGLRTALTDLPKITPELALQQFFNPEDAVKRLAARVVQRVEIRHNRQPVAHILPSQYEHSGDRAALDKIRGTPGIDLLFRKISEFGFEKVETIENLANHIHVGPDQFPHLHTLFTEASEMLGMPFVPDLFLELKPPGARTVGVERPMVMLSYALPSLCTRDELLFVMGHELGHIRSGHTPYQMALNYLPQILDAVGSMTLGIGGLVGAGVGALLFDWYRKSELTCDRCGLLVCQNSDAALSMMMKLAGAPPSLYGQLNIDAFLQQSANYDALDQSALSRTYKLVMSTMSQGDHPWLALRARELARWVNSGDYERLLSAPSKTANQCKGCSGPLTPDDVFCSTCGRRVGT